MAIKREFYTKRSDGVNLYRQFSDEGFQIQKVGTDEVYDEAIDVEGTSFEYTETATRIDAPKESDIV